MGLTPEERAANCAAVDGPLAPPEKKRRSRALLTPPSGEVIASERETLDAMRSLFVKKCFAMLSEPAQMNRLRLLLQAQNNRQALAAFQVVLNVLVPHTKPEESGGGRVSVQIVNGIARPEPATIEVTAS